MGADEERLKRQIEAYHDAALAFAAVKLGLPEAMGDRRFSAEALAAELGLSPPHLHRYLRGLASIGICEELADGGFALTELGHSLRKGAPSRLGEKAAIVVEQYWRPWAELTHTLQTGEPAFAHVFGMKVAAWRREHDEQGALYSTYLAEENFAEADDVIEAIDCEGVKTVALIGGGYGGLLAAILQAEPKLDGVLMSPPQVGEAAAGFLAKHGVAERVRRVGGDVRKEIAVTADLYLVKGLLQQWDDASALSILRNCRKAMPPHAKLLVVERAMPERASDDPAAVMLDLHMMTISGGKARTIAEFEALLSESGFLLAGVKATRAGLSIIEAAAA